MCDGVLDIARKKAQGKKEDICNIFHLRKTAKSRAREASLHPQIRDQHSQSHSLGNPVTHVCRVCGVRNPYQIPSSPGPSEVSGVSDLEKKTGVSCRDEKMNSFRIDTAVIRHVEGEKCPYEGKLVLICPCCERWVLKDQTDIHAQQCVQI